MLYSDRKTIEASSRYDTIFSRNLGLILAIVISVIYSSILHKIYIWRTKQVVYFKSPMMILIGGLCLWIDSILNIYINTDIFPKQLSLKYEYVCVSSIATTFIFN